MPGAVFALDAPLLDLSNKPCTVQSWEPFGVVTQARFLSGGDPVVQIELN